LRRQAEDSDQATGADQAKNRTRRREDATDARHVKKITRPKAEKQAAPFHPKTNQPATDERQGSTTRGGLDRLRIFF